jgi:hypothetical protein
MLKTHAAIKRRSNDSRSITLRNKFIYIYLKRQIYGSMEINFFFFFAYLDYKYIYN